MLLGVKRKVKGEGRVGYSLGVFRVVTLFERGGEQGRSQGVGAVMQHAALKYLYKMN